ncbi:MAG: GAF domain-containing protein [Leeuwenhoekiella sp.]
MQDLDHFPIQVKLSFKKLVDEIRSSLSSVKSEITQEYYRSLLAYIEKFPEIEDGISDFKDLEKYQDVVKVIMDSVFPSPLRDNEIKAAAIPFHNTFFNASKRFEHILKDAGDDFQLKLRVRNEEDLYIMGCLIILNTYYDQKINFSWPMHFDIPDATGITRHYGVALNADFVEFERTENAVEITPIIVQELLNNYEDLSLWEKYFPPKSWVLKGVTILNLSDVTINDAVSNLKSTLLYGKPAEKITSQSIQRIFRAMFGIADLRVGFTEFNDENNSFLKIDKSFAESFILDKENSSDCRSSLCEGAYNSLISHKKYFTITDVEEYALSTDHNLLSENLLNQNVQSCILAPIAKSNKLLGVLELISTKKYELNSINATKLDSILPYIVSTVERRRFETENRIKAVIQSECTSIHPSVLWIFEEEAKRFITNQDSGKFAAFRDISFEDVYPLYGQIDIVGSSDARNTGIQKDILIQLGQVNEILDLALEAEPMPIYEQVKYRIEELVDEIGESISASSETQVFNLLKEEVNPLLNHLNTKIPALKKAIDDYKEQINKETGLIYKHRKEYDDTVQHINQNLATFLDRKQQEAQNIFPHYFERYKTDGVDHNIYIGPSMNQKDKFSMVYLYNLRLWQLRTMCEMESQFYLRQEDSGLQLDAASLILVFSSTLSIRYRMDEKKFDVDGTYNARYEIIKKRIDKALVRGTDERITQKGKIVIIYSQDSDEIEYKRYIKYLQQKGYLGDLVEDLELEDVQGVVGLKALRVEVLYTTDASKSIEQEDTVTYEDLMEVLD